MDTIGLILKDAFWSGIAAVGFAVLFNVPPRLLLSCILVGAFGHASRTILIELTGTAIEPATLFAGTVVGILAKWEGKRTHAPPVVFAISGAIPMVPGLFAYSAMIGIIQATVGTSPESGEILIEAAINFIRVALILAGLATGIVLPTLIFSRERPVV